MCQGEIVVHKGYERLNVFKLLKSVDGVFLISHYVSRKKEYDDLIRKVFDELWEENKKEKRPIKELIEIVEKNNKVSITVEEQKHLTVKRFEKQRPRKLYLFIK